MLQEELKIKRTVSIFFEGKNIDEMRNYLLANSKVMIVIGGAAIFGFNTIKPKNTRMINCFQN